MEFEKNNFKFGKIRKKYNLQFRTNHLHVSVQKIITERLLCVRHSSYDPLMYDAKSSEPDRYFIGRESCE